MKTISILGTGWLGLPLVQKFRTAGYAIKASATSERRKAELSKMGIEAFIVNIDSLTHAIQNFLKSNILIINIPSKNVAGYLDLAAEIEISDIEHIVFVSSTSVYTNVEQVITESSGTYDSSSPLLEIEELFKRIEGVQATIVRFAGLIGYDRHPGRFHRPGRRVQNPDSAVNLIHRDDCVEIIWQIIRQRLWGEVLNCCADTHPTKREFYTHAARSIGQPVPEFGASPSQSGKVISNHKVKHLLGFEFQHPDLMHIDLGNSGA